MSTALISRAARPLSGTAAVPGDKSISHRALMLGALAVGETSISGLLEGEDVLRTAAAMRALGVKVTQHGVGSWTVSGVGVGGLMEPEDMLDMGNSGTGTRLLIGVVATHDFTTHFTGDASLRSRPMRRVTDPLSRMGAGFVGRSGGRLPLAIIGTGSPLPTTYETPVPSAQVKSAVLLAGLNAPGTTTVIERQATRDHTEMMLQGFGAELNVELLPGGGRSITLVGQPELKAQKVGVPADPSSAAFPVVAALLVPGSRIMIPGVGLNPLRDGLYRTLKEMGAEIHHDNVRREAGEPVADLTVFHSRLMGIDVPPDRAPSMIDEYPILAIAAACANGTTRMRGLAELRVKESDRLTGIARGLTACGAKIEIDGDDLIVHGSGRAPDGGATIDVELDHRIGMSFLVLGMASRQPVAIDDAASIGTSFPDFSGFMNALGANIAPCEVA